MIFCRNRFYNALSWRDESRVPVAVCPEPMACSFAGADPAALVTRKLARFQRGRSVEYGFDVE